MKKLLITGGAGFIGTNFVEYFTKRGWQVTILDNLSRKGSQENLDWLKATYPKIRFVKADMRTDLKVLEEEVVKHEVIFHLAAQVAVTTSVQNPREDFEINVVGTLNLLEAIRAKQVNPVLIYASTNKVYGGMEDIVVVEEKERYAYRDLPHGIPENRLLDFHSPYGCSKGTADQYVRDYARIYGLKTVVFRQSCIYGPRQYGIEDQGWIAWFTIAALLGRPVTIYGDGKQVRDVLHVEDLARAYEQAALSIEKVKGEVFNVGGGAEKVLAIKEVFPLLEKFLGRKVPYAFGEWRPGDQPVYVSDVSKAADKLQWQPKIDPEAGIRSLFDWCQKNVAVFTKLGF
jgi:CDP-paratose 2-epimerase